jgi:hypothetical protein
MVVINLQYATWIITVTGKWQESIDTDSKTIFELILDLDKKYPGFKDIFIPPEIGKLNIRTGINLIRSGSPSKGVIDPNEKIMKNDTLIFY